MTWTTQQRSKAASLTAIAAGDGAQVLLIHGVGLCADAWGAQLEPLSQDHQVLAVDMPGHGQSPELVSATSLRDFTDCIADCINKPTVIVGHSFGAMIALDIAVHHPRFVRGVVALNAIYRRSSAARSAVIERANSPDGKRTNDPTSTLDRWFSDQHQDARQACEFWLNQANPSGYQTAYRIFAQEDGPYETSLQNLNMPALFMTGENEPNSTPKMSEKMANLTPNGRAIIVEDAAHMMPMTHPDEVNAALIDFARECFQ